jgi:peptide deformylase
MKRDILLLGNPNLYEKSEEVRREELPAMKSVIEDLHDTMMDYRKRYGAGRAIAAPQIGVKKRLIYMNIGEPIVFINPSLSFPDEEKMTVLDDCMSFPGLCIKLHRYVRCRIDYYDIDWKPCYMEVSGDLSELLQHEYDHLDGILATMRAVDEKAFYMDKSAYREV